MAHNAVREIIIEGIIYLTQGQISGMMECMKYMTESLLSLPGFLVALDLPEILTRRVSVFLGVLHNVGVEQMLNRFLGGQAVSVLVGDLR